MSNGFVVPIVRLLPVILKIFPEFAKSTVQLGKVIPILNVEPSSQELLEQALARQPKFKRKKRTVKDTKYVITLDSAIKCVEEGINDKKVAAAGLIATANQLFNSTTGDSPTGNRIIEAMREKVLPQTALRKRTTYRYSKRAI